MKTMQDKIRLLSIFHYVLGGIMGLFSFFPVIHLVIGIAVLAGGFDGESNDVPPRFIGIFFIAIASLMILAGLTISTLVIINGRKLSKYRGYTFCFVIACIECAFMPFGTVLGIFTILALMDESAKELFNRPIS